jgi:glycosyltransferase involved in cell wall biosynthesis
MSVHESSTVSPYSAPTSGPAGATPTIPLVHVINAPFSLHFIAGQVGFMAERGFSTSVITSPGEHLEAFGRREGVAVYGIDMPRRITPLRDLVTLARMYRRLRQIRPAIVHAHTPKGGLLGMIAAWMARVPVRIYHIRGLPFVTAKGMQRRLLRATEWTACTLAHRVLCVSHSVRGVAIAEGVCDAKKVGVLLAGSGNGVDAVGRFNPERWAHTRDDVRSRHSIPHDAVVIGFVGRLVRDKGLPELVAAWKILREEEPRLHLIVIGGFESRDPVPADAQAVLRSDPRIHLIGWESNTPPYYTAMDVFTLPSHREGFSNVLLEASSMGLPVVTTRIPGCTDAVDDGVTGTLVPAGNVETLTTALRAYITDAALRQRHARAGRDKVLFDFRREAIWEALYSEYHRLLRRDGSISESAERTREPVRRAPFESILPNHDHATSTAPHDAT